MKQSYRILKEAVEHEGVKSVASKLSLSSALVYKWCQDSAKDDLDDTASGAANPLDRIKKIYDATQDETIIHWVCQIAEGYFVKNIEVNKLSCESKVVDNIQQFIKSFSEALDSISESYQEGNKITCIEAERIRKEWEELKSIGEGFVRACEAGKFDKTK